jgi:hypothetical protein
MTSAHRTTSSAPAMSPARASSAARTPPGLPRGRLALLAAGGLALLVGLAGALVLVGAPMPATVVPVATAHGPLMAMGFLGTVIALERAVALDRRWAYAAPMASALGAVALIAGSPSIAGVALAVGAALLLAVYAAFARTDRSLHIAVQAAGAGAWLTAAALLAIGMPVSVAVPWLAAFLVLTVTGERLELARLGGLVTAVRRRFIVGTWIFVGGVTASLAVPDAGIRVGGVGLLVVAAWLARYDIARRTVRTPGVTRYIATCLLAGYAWLAVAGAAWAITGTTSGAGYDVRLHALFLGFIISMVLGHAPVIVPSVLRVPLPYHAWSYGALVLLHAGLVVRVVGGDLLSIPGGLEVGGILNVAAMLAFVVGSAAASAAEIRRRHVIGARRLRARAA